MTNDAKTRTCGDFGGRTAKGNPCARSAGWGTNASDGPCKYHQLGDDSGGPDWDQDWWRQPDPPESLSVEAQRWWSTIVHNWKMGPESLPVLRGALETWDLYREAMETVRTEGMVVRNPDSGNMKRHPAAYVANNAFNSFRLAMKQLGLEPMDLEEDDGYPDSEDILPITRSGGA